MSTEEKTSISELNNLWDSIEPVPDDPILGMIKKFNEDKFPNKVNISVGAYRDENGKPYVLKCVKKSIEKYAKDNVNHEYIPMGGDETFINYAIRVAYGDDFKYLNRVAAVQSISGSGALEIGQSFLKKFYPYKKIMYYSSPTWANHIAICKGAGLEVGDYRYYDPKAKDIDFEGMCEDLEKLEEHSMVLFHACGHNPTGVDLSHEQWEKVLKIVIKKEILPVFDMAYQGFVSGDLNEDAFSVRLFANSGINMLVAQSFAKNFGLYGERIGCLSVLTQNEKQKFAIKQNLAKIVRSKYSSPPKFGAMIINNILSNEELKNEWLEEIKLMAKRIIDMRVALKTKLEEVGSKLDWSHIVKQKGMFAFTGLTPEQCDRLKEEFHVYTIRSGRISIAGLNPSNVDYVAKAFHEVTKGN